MRPFVYPILDPEWDEPLDLHRVRQDLDYMAQAADGTDTVQWLTSTPPPIVRRTKPKPVAARPPVPPVPERVPIYLGPDVPLALARMAAQLAEQRLGGSESKDEAVRVFYEELGRLR